MFGAVEAPIVRLVRVRIGPVRLDGLRAGAVRPLKAPEIRGLVPAAAAPGVATTGATGPGPRLRRRTVPSLDAHRGTRSR